MTTRSYRPSLVRSIPFWILVAGSLATSAVGVWLTLDKLGVMETALTAGTATGVEVYVGQVWAIIGGILIATGLVGLALALVLAAVRSLVPAVDIEVVEPLDWTDEDLDAEPVAVAPVAVAPVVAEPVTAEPVVAEEPITKPAADSDASKPTS